MLLDPSWEISFLNGEIIEEFSFESHKVLVMKNLPVLSNIKYLYRMFFFKMNSSHPYLIFNLEVSLRFGGCSLGVHTESEHINYGPAEPNMTLKDFKSWALLIVKKDFL